MGLRERAVVGTAIDGLVVISLKQVGDERGTIREYHRASDESWGPWQQVNVTETKPGRAARPARRGHDQAGRGGRR